MSTALQANRKFHLTGHEAGIYALAQGVQPNEIYSGAGDGWIVRWNLDDPELGRLIAKVETQVFALYVFPDHPLIVAGNMNGGIHWVDLEDETRNRNVQHHGKGVFFLLRIKDSVFSGGGQGLITRWDVASRRTSESLQLTNAPLRCADFCPFRNELAVGSSDNSIYLLDASTLQLKHRIPDAHDNSVFSVCYNGEGDRLYSGGRDAHLKCWSLDPTPALLYDQAAHWFTINSVVLSPSQQWLATGSRDRTIKIWDAEGMQLLKVLDTARDGCHINSVNALQWSRHREQLVSASDDRSLIVWQIKD